MTPEVSSSAPDPPPPAPAPRRRLGGARRGARWLAAVKSPRVWIGLLVTVLWLGVMGRIWLREGGRMGISLRRMGLSPEVLLVSWTEFDQFMWIEQNGKRLGLTRLTIHPMTLLQSRSAGGGPGALPGYILDSHTRLTMRLMGFELPIELATAVTMNASFEMETMQARLAGAGQRLLLQAFTEPGQLYYRLRVNPPPDHKNAQAPPKAGPPEPATPVTPAPETPSAPPAVTRLLMPGSGAALPTGNLPPSDLCGQSPLAEPIFLIDAVIPILTRTETLRPGQRWATRASDPLAGLLQAEMQVTVEARERRVINGDTVEVWRLTQQVGPVRSTVWYDLHGRLIEQRMDGGIRLALATPAEAHAQEAQYGPPQRFTEIDRAWIKGHIDPARRGQPLSALLPPALSAQWGGH